MKTKPVSQQIFSKNDWLERVYRKSESESSKQVASTSLRMFEFFCQNEGVSEAQMIENYQVLFKDNDIRSICLALDKFVQFLNQDHPEIILNPLTNVTFKKKNPKTIRDYFGFVKSYLRLCHAVKISSEDIKDYVQFPKIRKEPRKPISLETIKLIMNHADPRQKALYSILLSSGMRIGEALALTKQNFHLNENPVMITIDADITKTKEGRETYISREGVEKLLPFLEEKSDNEKILSNYDDIKYSVAHECRLFRELCNRIGLTERYRNSNRYVVNLHRLRSFFHTKASLKHGVEYANALDGHGAYLKQYYGLPLEERAKKYKELEPSLLIESVMLESEKTKDNLIESLQEQMEKLQAKMTRLELLNKP